MVPCSRDPVPVPRNQGARPRFLGEQTALCSLSSSLCPRLSPGPPCIKRSVQNIRAHPTLASFPPCGYTHAHTRCLGTTTRPVGSGLPLTSSRVPCPCSSKILDSGLPQPCTCCSLCLECSLPTPVTVHPSSRSLRSNLGRLNKVPQMGDSHSRHAPAPRPGG